MNKPATKSNPEPAMASALAGARPRFPLWLLAVLLALVTIAVYWSATRCDFVNYDDTLYVTTNVHVQNGLTLENLKWVFFNPEVDFGYWHPLTLLSHMADCQLFGLKPWGHHLTNVLLHALNAALVFALLKQMTGATWRSLLVAALFAVHPLRVESVAWVSERKDVLSACFGLLALLFYVRYAKKVASGESSHPASDSRPSSPSPSVPSVPSVAKDPCSIRVQSVAKNPCSCEADVRLQSVATHSALDYGLALFFFACSLMSKPMLVTFPFVMFLLDYWPLRRFQLSPLAPRPWTPKAFGASPVPSVQSVQSVAKNPGLWRLVFEKIPFFALAAAASVVTFMVSKRAGVVAAGESLPFAARGANALVSYCRYLGKLFWPTDLAIFYPHPGHWPMTKVLLAGGLMLGISVLLVVKRRRYPFLLMGWLWYCGMLVPAIGLVQVGAFSMADRYTYLPSLGVLLLAVWGACELTRGWRRHGITLSVAGSAAIILCMAVTRQQLVYWQDSETLSSHALEVTENNFPARYSLGAAFFMKGQIDEAIRQFQEVIRFTPDDAQTRNDLGAALGRKGEIDEAIIQFQEAIRLKPDGAESHINLGTALLNKGKIDEAIFQFQEAVRVKPDDAGAHNNLGTALLNNGQIDEAIRQLQETIRLKPGDAGVRNKLGAALGMKGRTDEAIIQFREALRLKPDDANARNNLGIALGKKGQTN